MFFKFFFWYNPIEKVLESMIFNFTIFMLYGIVITLSRSGGTADALASGASGSNIVWVQIPSPA